MFDIHTFLNDLLSGIVFFIGYLVHHKTQIAKAVAQVAPVAETVAAAADATNTTDRDTALKLAAYQAIQALGANVAALNYQDKSAIADRMATFIDDNFKADVTPAAVESVLNTITTELSAIQK